MSTDDPKQFIRESLENILKQFKAGQKPTIYHPIYPDQGGYEITGMWIDEMSNYPAKPKKQRKQKQQLPFWVANWRKK